MLKNIGLEMCSTDDGNNKYVRKIVSGISPPLTNTSSIQRSVSINHLKIPISKVTHITKLYSTAFSMFH
jgi:hypothetical protein